MVQMTEFRVVMPLSVEEYRVAQMYMVTRMQERETSGSEGVEVLVNRPFENEQFGKGQYTSKIYRMQSKAPSWLAAIAPTNSLVVEEEAWNAYPKCKTILKCPYFPRFKLTIETVHVADNGQSPNAHDLPGSALGGRMVETIDIAAHPQDYWSYVIGGDAVDLATFQSQKTGRGLLVPGWQETCRPVMTAYKLVTVDAPYWGFGSRLEQLVLGGERALFAESHKQCFAWIDEWIGLTFDDVRKLELQMDQALRRTMAQAPHGVVQPQDTCSSKAEATRNGEPLARAASGRQDSPAEDGDDGREEQPVDSQQKFSQGRLRIDSGMPTVVSVTM